MTNPPPAPIDKPADDLVVRAGVDRDALGELYDEIYPPVFRYCLRRTGNRGLAEDITSTVFLSVADNISGFPGTTYEEFRRWVFTIATNEIHANHRSTTRRRTLLADAARSGQLNAATMDQPDISDDGDALQAAIMQLDERAQTMITLRFFSELPYADIGHILNISPGAARTAVSRALEQIRNDMGSR